jgi:diaminopimelate epimerase
VVASALAAFLETGNGDWRIKTRGGNFTVTFDNQGHRFNNIWLHGPAQMVYKGDIIL